jgi:hypothetical protein
MKDNPKTALELETKLKALLLSNDSDAVEEEKLEQKN